MSSCKNSDRRNQLILNISEVQTDLDCWFVWNKSTESHIHFYLHLNLFTLSFASYLKWKCHMIICKYIRSLLQLNILLFPFYISGIIHIWHDVKIFDSGPIVRLRLHKTRPHTPCHAFHFDNRENCKWCQACDNLLHFETHSEDCLAMHVHSSFHRTANISAVFLTSCVHMRKCTDKL